MWDLVIAQDFFLQFDHKNLLAGEAPMRYRRVVLEPGGSVSANDLVKNFLRRPQNMTALQRWMGEEFAGRGRWGGVGSKLNNGRSRLRNGWSMSVIAIFQELSAVGSQHQS